MEPFNADDAIKQIMKDFKPKPMTISIKCQRCFSFYIENHDDYPGNDLLIPFCKKCPEGEARVNFIKLLQRVN